MVDSDFIVEATSGVPGRSREGPHVGHGPPRGDWPVARRGQIESRSRVLERLRIAIFSIAINADSTASFGHFYALHASSGASSPSSWILRVMVLRPMPRRCAASMRRPWVATRAVRIRRDSKRRVSASHTSG